MNIFYTLAKISLRLSEKVEARMYSLTFEEAFFELFRYGMMVDPDSATMEEVDAVAKEVHEKKILRHYNGNKLVKGDIVYATDKDYSFFMKYVILPKRCKKVVSNS